MEVFLACSDAEEMAMFFERMFDAKVIFKGRMAGEPFCSHCRLLDHPRLPSGNGAR